jgi:hypothetical protein
MTEELDAEIAARYLARLVLRRVERADAVSLTASYVSGIVIARGMATPKPPWQD